MGTDSETTAESETCPECNGVYEYDGEGPCTFCQGTGIKPVDPDAEEDDCWPEPSKRSTWTVARQIAFFPSASGRKLHAAHKISHTAVCGASAELEQGAWLHTTAGDDSSTVHPIACKKCLRLSTSPGYSATGIEA